MGSILDWPHLRGETDDEDGHCNAVQIVQDRSVPRRACQPVPAASVQNERPNLPGAAEKPVRRRELEQPKSAAMATVEQATPHFSLRRHRKRLPVMARRRSSRQTSVANYRTGAHTDDKKPSGCNQHGGRGCWRNNVFRERLLKLTKHGRL